MRSDLGELLSEVREADSSSTVPLGTARWMGLDEATTKFRYRDDGHSDQAWIGQAFNPAGTPLGYADDRHVCLVSGTRGGKGAGVIIPSLCLWPGSCIIIDPKGENGTVTARRRGNGSAFAHGLGQKVCILDPFGEVSLETTLKARFNPLDVIEVDGDLAVADAGRIAAAIVVRENKNDPYWEEAARNLIKGFILHVLSEPYFEGLRNLVTVRRLLTQGDWLLADKLREAGDEKIPSAFGMLWERMRKNSAFNGVVAGVGEQMMSMAERTRSGVLATARTNTEFLDDRPMQRLLEASDFDLAEIKTNPGGLTIYLTLPQRYMDTHYRWLRLMISLAVGEMERIKGRPRTGYPTLFVLDEFAGLKRMEAIEHAVAQAAGFGVKFFFVAQNLAQLKVVYDEGWETFVSNSGLKMFFQIDDDFTRAYLTRLLGEYEVKRETRSTSRSQSSSLSTTEGTSASINTGTSSGVTDGGSRGDSLTYAGLFRIFSKSDTRQVGRSWSRSRTDSLGKSQGTSLSRGETHGDSTTTGWGEAVHKRALLNPDEIGRFLSRIDEYAHPAYPGIVLAILPGRDPLLARRVNYFEAPMFAGCFDPHPNYPPPMTLAERAEASRRAAAALPPPVRTSITAAGIWRLVQIAFQMLAQILTTGFAWARWMVRTTIALAIAGLIIAVLIKFLAGPDESKTASDSRPPPAQTPAAAAPAPGSPASSPSGPAPVPAAIAAPVPARLPARAQGSIFPLGAKAWVAPASTGDDPSVGLFENGTGVEILDRVNGPYGWDWLKVKGPTNDGQVVEAFVRADRSGQISGYVTVDHGQVRAFRIKAKDTVRKIIYTVFTHKGHYQIFDLPSGSYDVFALEEGYESPMHRVELHVGEVATANLVLKTTPPSKRNEVVNFQEFIYDSSLRQTDMSESIRAPLKQNVELVDFDTYLPPSPGRDLWLNRCGGCHGLRNNVPPPLNPKSEEQWRGAVGLMLDSGWGGDQHKPKLDSSVSAEARETIVKYFGTNFGEGAPRRDLKLDEPMLDEDELVNAIFVQYELPPGRKTTGTTWPSRVSPTVWFNGGRGTVMAMDLTKSLDYSTRFRQWQIPQPDSAFNRAPLHTIVDVHGQVYWVEGKGAAVGELDPKTGKMSRYPSPSNGALHTARLDSKNNIWYTSIFGSDVIGRFNTETKKIAEWNPSPDHTGAAYYGIVVDKKDRVWATGISQNIIVSFDPKTEKWTTFPVPMLPIEGSAGAMGSGPRRPTVDSKGNIWFSMSTPDAIGMLNPDTGKINTYSLPWRYATPYECYADGEDNLWIGLWSYDGLGKFDTKTHKFTYFPYPEFGDHNEKIEMDLQGTFWLSSGGQLASFNPKGNIARNQK